MLYLGDKDKYQERLKRDSQQDFISSDRSPLQNDDRSEFTKGLDAGIDQTAALGGGLLAMIGSATGNDDAFFAGMDYYNDQMDLASESEADIGRLEDIDGFDDFLSFAAYTAGNAIPSLGTALLGGGIGGIAAKRAVKEGVQAQAKEYAKKRVSDKASDGFRKRVADDYAAAALSKKAGYGAAGGAYLASTGMGAGESFTRILEEEGEEAPGVALITGMVSGGLDAIAPMRALKRVFPKREYDSVVRAMGKGAEKKIPFYSRALREMGKQAGVEGVTEGMQEIVQNIALEYVENNYSDLSGAFIEALTDETKYSGYLNSAAAGIIGGGMFGGVTGGFGDPSSRPSRVSRQEIDTANEQAELSDSPEADIGTEPTEVEIPVEDQLSERRRSKQEDARKNADAQERYTPLFDQIEARRKAQEILEQAEKDQVSNDAKELAEKVKGVTPVGQTPLRSLKGKTVTFEGETGILTESADGFVIVTQEEDIFIESGEAQSAESLGITVVDRESVERDPEVTFNANDSTFTLRGKQYKYARAREEGGQIVSIQAFDQKGNRRNIKEPRIIKIIEQKKQDAESARQQPEPVPVATDPVATEVPTQIEATGTVIAPEITSPQTNAEEVEESFGLEGERLTAAPTATTPIDRDFGKETENYNKMQGELSNESLDQRTESMTSGEASTVQQRAGTDTVERRPFGGKKKLIQAMSVRLKGQALEDAKALGAEPALFVLGKKDVTLGDFDSDTPEVKALVSAVMEVAERGMPQEFLFGAKGLFVTGKADRLNKGGYAVESQFVFIGRKLIRDAAYKEGGLSGRKGPQRQLAHLIAHEHWHYADALNGYTENLPSFRVALSEDQDEGAPQVEFGSINEEIYDLWRSGDQEIGEQFRYPLQMFGKRLKKAISKGNENFVLRVTQQEIFAQLGAIYLDNPGALKIKAPKAYAMIRSIIQNPTLKSSEVISGKGEIRNDRTESGSASVQPDVRTRTGSGSREVPDPDGAGPASAGSGGQGRTNTGVAGPSNDEDGDATGPVVSITPKQDNLKNKQSAVREQFERQDKEATVVPKDQENTEETVGETQSQIKGLEPIQLPVDELSLSQDVPQFKTGANNDGVVERLGGTFDPTGVGPIIVWERNDGRKEVISGRHRFDLAKRSGEKTILSQVFREADGFTVEQAAILDAELNLRDGQGQVKDYVNYFQADKITKEEAVSRGLLGRATGKRAYAIATDGSEELITAHRNDQITDAEAEAVALNAPGNTALQAAGLKALIDGSKAIEAVNVMKAIEAVGPNAGGGGQQGSMFALDESAMQTATEMAKIVSKKQRQITADLSAITGASKKPEVASKYGVDVKDANALKDVIAALKAERVAWDKWHTNPELVAEINAEMTGDAEQSSQTDLLDIQFEELSEQSQKVTASKILYGEDDPLPVEGKSTVVNVAKAFDAKTKEAYPDRNLSIQNEENSEIVSDLIAHEAMEALNEEGNAGEWYQEKVANAMSLAAQKFPELKTDPNAKFAFTAIMAVTSNGASVPENSTNTFKLYEEYRNNKVFTVFGVGKEAGAMKQSFELLNDLVIAYSNEGGLSGLRAFMDQDVTVKQLEDDYNLKVSGENVGTKLKGSAILGPKVGGGFYQNLNGNYDPLTMDRWFMRTYGRLTGSLMAEAERKLPAQIAKFRETALRDENKKTLKQDGIKRTQLKNDDDYVVAYARKIQGQYARGGFKEKNDLNKASNTLVNSQKEQQDPRNGKERVYIRGVMTRALEKVNKSLADIGAKPVNMGALQAIVWYPEKELYKLHGVGNAKSEPTDYETEFRKIIEGEEPGQGVSGPDGSSQQPRARGLQPATGVSEQDETISDNTESTEPLKARPPQGRAPALERAVQGRINRDITAQELNEVFEENGRPIREMVPEQVPDLVADEKALAALTVDKREFWNQPLQNGVRYGARLDIPAYSRPPAGADPADIVTVHYKKATAQSPKASGKISHMKTIRMTNVEFAVPEKGAKKIALGAQKNTIATIEGDYVQQSDEINHQDFKSLMNDPNWTQVSMNPQRHSFFYTLKDQSPVLTADEVIQVGNLVLAKNINKDSNPVPDDFLFGEFPEAITGAQDLNAQIREENKPILNRVKKQFRKYLAPEGLLPKEVFEEKIKRDSELGAVEMDIRRILAEYDEAVSEVYNRDLEDSEQKELQAALTTKFSEIDSLNLDPAIKNAIIGMRRYMDHMSIDYAEILFAEAKQLSEQGRDAKAVAKIDLLNTIASNVGSYANRSYQAFDDPKWANKVPDDVLNAAREYLTNAGVTNSENVINEILKEGTAFDSMEAFIRESKLGAKDLSLLKQRKDIAPEIRALLGEYSDPKINFTKSANKMSRLLFNDRFLKRVKEIGMDTFLYDRETAPPEAYVTFASETSDVMAPLNGLKTTPEIAQAFRDALGKEQMEDWYRAIVQANGAIKYGKTVIAPTTLARNYLSAYMFTIANGHFNIGKIGQSIEAAEVYFKGKGEKFSYVRRLKELGVVYDTPYAGEMMALLDDAKQDMFMGGKLKGAKWFFDNATKLYQYGDDLWKIVGFENEIDILMDAKGISREAAEPLAAKRIRDTYPTYSLVGSGVQKLRRFPLAGTFVSFPAEIIRTGFNIVKYLKNDLADPEMAGTVPRRVAGLAMASGGVYALQEALKDMVDVDDDEEEAVRLLGPKWSENSNLAFIGREDGKLKYVDMSAFDPYNFFKRPINALMRDQPIEDAVYQSATEAMKPFFGTDIAFQNIVEVFTNEKASGGTVFNESEGSVEQLQAITYHLIKGLGPSALGNIERTTKAIQGDRNSAGRVYKIEDEMAALVGFRVSTLDPKVSLHFRAFDFNQKKREATKILTSKFRDVNDVSDREITDAFNRASIAREEAFEEMMKIVSAARKSGLNRIQTMQILRNNGISKKDAIALSDGEMSLWEMSDSTLKNSVKKSDLLFGEATGRQYENRWKLIQQLLSEQD